MYQYVQALCLPRTSGSQWQIVDLSNIIVKTIYEDFSKVYLTLSNPNIVGNVYVNFDSLKSEFFTYNDTLNSLLIYLNNRTLDTIPNLPNSQVKYAKYSDAFMAGYKAEFGLIGQILPDNYPNEDKLDIELTRPKYNTNMSLIHDYCLVSVNGYIHNTDSNGSNCYIKDGAISMRKANNNHIGIISFIDIGKLTKVNIDINDIYPQNDTSSLKDKIYFTVDENLDNKSYILILGGYLVFPQENIFWRNGNNSFALNLNNLKYIERIYETDMYLDLAPLGLTTNPINETMINLAELWSDEVIKKYLTLSQTFLVIIDNSELFINTISLKKCNLPGEFISHTEPTYPLVVQYGKIAEYVKSQHDNSWHVAIVDNFKRNYILSEQPYYNLENVTDALLPNRSFEFAKGNLLQIASYNI